MSNKINSAAFESLIGNEPQAAVRRAKWVELKAEKKPAGTSSYAEVPTKITLHSPSTRRVAAMWRKDR